MPLLDVTSRVRMLSKLKSFGSIVCHYDRRLGIWRHFDTLEARARSERLRDDGQSILYDIRPSRCDYGGRTRVCIVPRGEGSV